MGEAGAGDKTSMGMDPNVAGLLCYLFGWVSGLIFFLVEKEDKFVRFHAMQSMVVSFGVIVIYFVFFILAFIPYVWFIVLPLQIIVGIAVFILWIILMVKAYQGQKFKLPWAGNFAEKQAG
jgi:uncharacterized membrane protein